MRAFATPQPTLDPDGTTVDGMVIQSRDSIFHFTTALTCFITAGLLYHRGSWIWSAAFLAMSALMGGWECYSAFNSPILVIRGQMVTLYCRGVNAGSYMLRDLAIPDGTLSLGLALFALVLASTMLAALGMSRDFATLLSLRLTSIERLFLTMSGVWCIGAVVSLCYLDFPRRKLVLRGVARRLRVIYFDSRKQRDRLLISIRDLQLEQVMLRVGLGPDVYTTDLCDTDSPHDRGDGSSR